MDSQPLDPNYMSADEVHQGLDHLEQSFGPEQRIVDCRSALKRLEGDCELFQDLLGFYFSDAPKHVANIRAAVEAEDAEALRRAAHTLKGLVSNFDARTTMELAAALEDLGRDGNVAEARKRVPALEHQIDRLTAALAESFALRDRPGV